VFWSHWSSRKKLALSLAALAVVASLTVASLLFWQLHKASTALRSFGDALVQQDYQRAYNLTDPEFRKFTNYSDFLKAHDGLSGRVGNLRKLSWSSLRVKEEKDDWYGTADVQLEFDRGTLPFTFVLKKNGQWRVYSYHEL
jgi:hypothetical protein